MRAALAWLRRRLLEPEHPLAALEVRERSLGVVRLAREKGRLALAAAASLELPPGALKLSLVEPNILDAEAFRATLRGVLERAGIAGGGRLGLVLPDLVARATLLPARELQARRRADLIDVIRFRLRRALPFDVREARLAWSALPAGPGREAQLLVVAIPRGVLEQYEQACEALGVHAGLVELCGLALLRALEQERPAADRLLINWDHGYVSLLVSRGGVPVLIRTLAGDSVTTAEAVAREAVSTELYYRERLGGERPSEVVVRAAGAAGVEALERALALPVSLLDPWAALAAEDRGGLGQALAGASACVLGRAA